MSELTNPSGTHETSSLEGKILDAIHAPVINALARLNIIGVEAGDNVFKCNYQGKEITITIKVK